jgi:hypothetical protein
MATVKNTREEAVLLNLKKANNEIYLALDPLDRAYYATDDPDTYKRIEHVIEQLLQARNDIQEILDK